MATRRAGDSPATITLRAPEGVDLRVKLPPPVVVRPLDVFGAEPAGAAAPSQALPPTRSATLGWGTTCLDVRAIDAALSIDLHPAPPGPRLGEPLPDGHPLLRPTLELEGREAIRSGVVDQLLATATPPPKGQRPVVWVLGGPIGTGKGAVIEKLRAAEVIGRGVVQADADQVHPLIPEYQQLMALNDGRAATVVHREASEITRRVTTEAAHRGLDIMLNLTLASSRRLTDVQGLKNQGYRVVVVAVTSSVDRSIVRAGAGGRYVPMHDLLETHRDFARQVNTFLSIADEAVIVDHDGPTPHVAAVLNDGALETTEPAVLDALYAKRNIDLSSVAPDELR